MWSSRGILDGKLLCTGGSSNHSYWFFFNIYKFIYFILFIFVRVESSLLPAGFSLVAASGGISCCGARALGARAQQLWLKGSRAQAQYLWRTGLVAPQHVGSSGTRAWPVSPALAGGFLTTAPPGKSRSCCFNWGDLGHLLDVKKIYVHIYIYIYIYIYTHTYIYVCVCIYTCIHTYPYTVLSP